MKRSKELSGKTPPLIGHYRTLIRGFEKSYGTNIPFVLLVQIGNFFETYDESAQILGDCLKMTVSMKKGAKSAGFPICSQTTHILALAKAGFAIVRIIQTESADTKKQRIGSESSQNTQRVAIPGTTLNFVSDNPLAIIQGNTLLIYFSETNCYKLFELQSNDELLCKLMEFEPCELICSAEAPVKSIRHILPNTVLRQYFAMGFTAIHTLQKYLKILSQQTLLETIQEKSERILPKVALDARTVLNLTLFGKNASLADSISPKMTNESRIILRTILFNPLADQTAIEARQDKIKKLIHCDFLDAIHSATPKKNSCASLRNPLFKTTAAQFVTTDKNVSKFLEIIQKTILEIVLWKKWISTLRRSVEVDVEIPSPPEAPVSDESNTNAPIEEALLKFNAENAVQARVVTTGAFKHLFETNIKNESLLRGMRGIRIQSKSKSAKVVRFDSNDIQRARLECSENNARRTILAAESIKQFLEQFQELYSPELFETLSEIECFVALAYFFKHTAQKTSWPTFGDAVQVQNMSLPAKMTGKNNWINNSSNDHFIILKGSNGSGKTSFMRTLAINLLLSHCGLPVFAEQFETIILDRLFMRIGSSDCLATGKSSFVVEMEHMAAIAETMTARSALFIDELGCSCDAASGKKICDHFINSIQTKYSFCVFATHFDLEAGTVKEMGMCDGEYTYKIQDYGKNVSNRNAISVAERCGFPQSVLYHAERLLEE